MIKKSSQTLSELQNILNLRVAEKGGPSKYKLILIPLVILVSFSLVYFYQESQGVKLDRRRFRILSALERNISQKEISFYNQIKDLKTEINGQLGKYDTKKIHNIKKIKEDISNNKIPDNIIISRVETSSIPGYYFSDYLNKDPIRVLNEEYYNEYNKAKEQDEGEVDSIVAITKNWLKMSSITFPTPD